VPTSISDGPLGLEVKHRWNGGFTINDLESAMPRVILDPQEASQVFTICRTRTTARTPGLAELERPCGLVMNVARRSSTRVSSKLLRSQNLQTFVSR
jgi:hypothetical protein